MEHTEFQQKLCFAILYIYALHHSNSFNLKKGLKRRLYDDRITGIKMFHVLDN